VVFRPPISQARLKPVLNPEMCGLEPGLRVTTGVVGPIWRRTVLFFSFAPVVTWQYRGAVARVLPRGE